MLTVYIWNFRGKDIAWGHASLQVDHTYMSWWPEERNRLRSKVSNKIYSVQAIRNRLLSDDIAAERMPPDHQLVIQGLDEKKIKDWWQSFGLSRDGVLYQGPLQAWETLAQNCSTVAAKGLAVGGGDKYASWHRSWNLVWTPNDVLQYARSIQAGLASAHKR